MLVKVQILDYLKGFLILKASLARYNALSVVSGAFGVFRKSILTELNGYRVTVGEDMDITLKLQLYAMARKGSRIIFIPDAIAYTECPETWSDLVSQRIRWHKAYVDCLLTYTKALVRRFFKNGLPFFFLVDTTLIGVLLTVYNFVYMTCLAALERSIETVFIVAVYFASLTLISLVSNVLALHLHRKTGGVLSAKNFGVLALAVIADVFLFRMLVSFCMVAGTLLFVTHKHSWRKLERNGVKYVRDEAA